MSETSHVWMSERWGAWRQSNGTWHTRDQTDVNVVQCVMALPAAPLCSVPSVRAGFWARRGAALRAHGTCFYETQEVKVKRSRKTNPQCGTGARESVRDVGRGRGLARSVLAFGCFNDVVTEVLILVHGNLTGGAVLLKCYSHLFGNYGN